MDNTLNSIHGVHEATCSKCRIHATEFSYTDLKFCSKTLLSISSSPTHFKLQRQITLKSPYMHVQQQAIENLVLLAIPPHPIAQTLRPIRRRLKATARQQRLMVDNVHPNQGVASVGYDVWHSKTNKHLEHSTY